MVGRVKPSANGYGLPVEGQGGSRPTSCSTKYVRGREAVMPQLRVVAFIANRNEKGLLQLGGA